MSEDQQSGISFEALYSDDDNISLSVFLVHAQDFLKGFDADSAGIDTQTALRFVSSLKKEKFPANGGYEKASPFKKAAYMYVCLHECNPFTETISIGDKPVDGLSNFSHSVATLVGFSLVQRCLYGATVKRKDEKEFALKKSIEVSDHYMRDMIEASRDITVEEHFRTYSILFEALAYAAHNEVAYEEKVRIEDEWDKGTRIYPGLGVYM